MVSSEAELVRVFFLFFISFFLAVRSQDARKCGPQFGLLFAIRIWYSSLLCLTRRPACWSTFDPRMTGGGGVACLLGISEELSPGMNPAINLIQWDLRLTEVSRTKKGISCRLPGPVIIHFYVPGMSQTVKLWSVDCIESIPKLMLVWPSRKLPAEWFIFLKITLSDLDASGDPCSWQIEFLFSAR